MPGNPQQRLWQITDGHERPDIPPIERGDRVPSPWAQLGLQLTWPIRNDRSITTPDLGLAFKNFHFFPLEPWPSTSGVWLPAGKAGWRGSKAPGRDRGLAGPGSHFWDPRHVGEPSWSPATPGWLCWRLHSASRGAIVTRLTPIYMPESQNHTLLIKPSCSTPCWVWGQFVTQLCFINQNSVFPGSNWDTQKEVSFQENTYALEKPWSLLWLQTLNMQVA